MGVRPDHPVPGADEHEEDYVEQTAGDVHQGAAAAVERYRREVRDDRDEEGVDPELEDAAPGHPRLRRPDRAPRSPLAAGYIARRLPGVTAGWHAAELLLPRSRALGRGTPLAGTSALLGAARLSRHVPLRHAAPLTPRSTPA